MHQNLVTNQEQDFNNRAVTVIDSLVSLESSASHTGEGTVPCSPVGLIVLAEFQHEAPTAINLLVLLWS